MYRYRTREVQTVSRRVLDGRYTLAVGGEAIDYELHRSGRRTLGISVTPRAEVRVTAPHGEPRERVEKIMRRRGEWICRQLRETAALPPPPLPKEWVSGETHLYLGRQYRLSVRSEYRDGVRLVGRYFRVGGACAATPDGVEASMTKWYLDHARATFQRRLENLVEITPRLGLKEPPPLIVRRIRTRWGSCAPAGRILMNAVAIKLPVACIDYILMHELCHLRYSGHDRAFWRHLDRCMPDWQRWRRRLDRAEV